MTNTYILKLSLCTGRSKKLDSVCSRAWREKWSHQQHYHTSNVPCTLLSLSNLSYRLFSFRSTIYIIIITNCSRFEYYEETKNPFWHEHEDIVSK